MGIKITPSIKNLRRAIKAVGNAHNAPYRDYVADYGKITLASADESLKGDIVNVVAAFCYNTSDVVKIVRGHLTIMVDDAVLRDRVEVSLLRPGLPPGVEVKWEVKLD